MPNDFATFERMVPWMNPNLAYKIYEQYASCAVQPDAVALGDLYNEIHYADPNLALWLCAYGPSLLDDRKTITEVNNAYAHEYFTHGDREYTPRFPQLPSRRYWKADELSPGTSDWLRLMQGPSIPGREAQPVGREMVHIEVPELVPVEAPKLPSHKTAKGRTAANFVKQLAGGISASDLHRDSFMLQNMGFDSFWSDQVAPVFDQYEKGFSNIMKELYLNPGQKYQDKDFYDWLVFILSRRDISPDQPNLAAIYLLLNRRPPRGEIPAEIPPAACGTARS